MGEDRTGAPGANQRLTVAQAADTLGITEGAVRSRIKRGTVPTTKEGGTVYVLLGGGTSQTNQTPNTGVPHDQSELVEELRARVAFLERELGRRGDETARLHQIVAGLTQANARLASRVPELEAPAETTEAAETVEEAPEGSVPRSGTPGAQEGARRPQGGSWWRRVFGR